MTNPNVVQVASIHGSSIGSNMSGSAQTFFTVASGKLVKINSITCANVHATNAGTLDLFVDKVERNTTQEGSEFASNETVDGNFYICKNISVDQGSTLVILETPIYLMEGDAFEGQASAASTLDLYISYEVISQ
tara:strand:- start:335 stop:736 length:402 start_codon:yes stop_codon:yes gene_type:complete